jgi:hypothetical protein
MMRTAADLFVGAYIREESGILLLVDYIDVDEEGVLTEGYEVDSGNEFVRMFDFDDEINIVKGE